MCIYLQFNKKKKKKKTRFSKKNRKFITYPNYFKMFLCIWAYYDVLVYYVPSNDLPLSPMVNKHKTSEQYKSFSL